MVDVRRSLTSFIAAPLLAVLFLSVAGGAPSEVQGDIYVPGDTPVTVRGNETTRLDIDGFFSITSAGPFDMVGGVSANLEISGSGWNPSLSQTRWTDVDEQEDYPFVVTLGIGPDVEAGHSNSYILTVTFVNSISGEVGSSSSSMVVRIDGVLENDDDDLSDDDESDAVVEDDSLPLWPIFLAVLLIGALVVAIWAWKNLEVVRDQDGSRRVLLREKDSGRIIGRKERPPPELDL